MARSGGRTLRARLEFASATNARGRHARAAQLFRSVLADLEGAAFADDPDNSYAHVRALIGLAISRFEHEGDVDRSLELLEEAQVWVEAHGPEDLQLVVGGQRGLLRLRTGRVVEAVEEMDAAARFIDVARPLDAAVLLLNRGSLHLELGNLDRAEADLAEVVRRAEAMGDTLLASKAQHNLGYAKYLGGDLPTALRAMEEAERGAPDRHASVGLIDKSQVLLEAGLLSDADATLAEAREHLARNRMVRDVAEVELLRAQCLVGLRRYTEAQRQARAAAARFDRIGNDPWAARARVAELQARLAEDRSTGVSVGMARRRAARALALADVGAALGEAGGRGVTVPAQLLAAEWLLAAKDPTRAREILSHVPGHLGRVALPLRLQHQAVAAQLAFDTGDRAAALRAVRKGQRMLAEHREGLGSVDAVTASAVHGVRLGHVDVAAALRTGRASALLDAVERGRATVAGSGRVVPPSDAESADLLTRARQEIESARLLGANPSGERLERRRAHLNEARRLQEAARRRAWQDGGGAATPTAVTARRLRRALSTASPSTVVANFVVADEALRVLRADASGLSMIRLASMAEVGERIRRTRADLDVLSNALIPAPMRAAARASLDRSLAWLDREVLAPIDAQGDLHIAARDLLLAVPWSSLPSRAGRRTWVNSWIDLQEAAVDQTKPDVVVVAGPGLRAAVTEAEAVAQTWDRATVLSGEEATCSATVEKLPSAAVVHLATHGRHETDNPLFSSLRLADGPLFAHELDGVDLRGAVVVLSACEAGLSTVRIGGEPLGLTSVLLRLGAAAVVSSVAPLRDDVAARVMPEFHGRLRSGATPGDALATAIAHEDEPVPLVCFGPLAV
ncbi:CHAT domain-containing protein [Oerskovia paurometabola]|uniref:CHAT domain-containing protein n=1 Tax=Oerskovia paurometabola TaxID=162170 RepID=A0ABW1XFD7_9CELL|nr:CHAT domain-containing protein [Oerskovia paurometabola]MBM7496455.1 tetratricopeptide (TPR) repeat protein [Oerskovia paurometabola]